MRIYFSIRKILYLLVIVYFTDLYAQEITRVAVLNYAAVLQELPRQSPELLRIEQVKAETETKMKELKEELKQLIDNLEQAESSGESSKVRKIQKEIEKLRNSGRKYVSRQNEEIAALQKKAAQSRNNNDIQRILSDVISQVAREQGYSIIINRSSQNLIWFDTGIDITETVIQQLRNRLK